MSGQVAITNFASDVIATCEQSRKEMLIAPFIHRVTATIRLTVIARPRGTDRPKAFEDNAIIT